MERGRAEGDFTTYVRRRRSGCTRGYAETGHGAVARGTSSHVSRGRVFSLSLSFSFSACLSAALEHHSRSRAGSRERVQRRPAFVGRSASRLPARAATAKKPYDDLIHTGCALLLVLRVAALLAILKTSPTLKPAAPKPPPETYYLPAQADLRPLSPIHEWGTPRGYMRDESFAVMSTLTI